MRLHHPHGDDYVSIHGDLVPIDDDGTFEAPETWADAFADRHDTTLDDLRVTETCEVVKQDGAVCGRDLPCPYHSDGED